MNHQVIFVAFSPAPLKPHSSPSFPPPIIFIMLRYGVLAAAVALASGQASQACLSDPGSCFDCDESVRKP